MRIPFQFTLEGKDWWKPFLPLWAAYLIYMGATQAMSLDKGRGNLGPAYFVVVLLVFLAFLAVFSVFSIVILRIVMSKLSIGDKGFEFRGDIGTYVGMIFGGTFLSIITIGFYFPWFIKKVLSWLASKTSFGGDTPEFLGKPGKLLSYFLLGLWLPLIAVLVLIIGTVGLSGLGSLGDSEGFAAGATATSMAGYSSAAMVTSIVTFVLVLVVFVPFMYLVYRWYVNFACAGATIRWKSDFWSSCFFILGQICLTIITLGIYWPAALLRIYRYFVGLTVIERDGVEKGRLDFDGPIGKGFGFLWGQALLCLITLGLYIPWGYAKVGRWVLGNTWYEGEIATTLNA